MLLSFTSPKWEFESPSIIYLPPSVSGDREADSSKVWYRGSYTGETSCLPPEVHTFPPSYSSMTRRTGELHCYGLLMTHEQLLSRQGKGIRKCQPVVNKLIKTAMGGLNLPWQHLGVCRAEAIESRSSKQLMCWGRRAKQARVSTPRTAVIQPSLFCKWHINTFFL